jgi:tetratricopeptide (TPR) repeat protein
VEADYAAGSIASTLHRVLHQSKWSGVLTTSAPVCWQCRAGVVLGSLDCSMMKIAIAFLIWTICSLAQAADLSFADGMAAYNRGDYATALKLWRPLAERGNADAQVLLGDMYSEGHGVPQDDAEAVNWYREAAEQGNAMGQQSLGDSYNSGFGVPQDYAEAVKWYRRAAEQGYDLGQHSLGMMYEDGRGVPRNYVQAYMWFHLDAAIKPAWAKSIAHIDAKMTPAQIDDAQRLVSQCQRQNFKGCGVLIDSR